MALTKGKAPWDLEKQSFVDVRSFAVYPTNTAAENNVAIQGAIDASPGQTLIFPSGIYNLSSTLTGLETVDLIGGDPGRQSQPVSSPDVELSWSGGASPILKYGGGASTVTGGKIEGFRINGNALASQGIQIKDHQHGTFKRLQVSDVTSAGIYMTNTNTYAEPTGFSEFEDIQIMLRGGSTNSANGINLDGFLGAGVQGVTLCSFNKIRIEHANGSGVLFGEAGDGMTFKNLLTFRADAEAGFGLYAGSTAATQGILNNVFINLVASGGVRIETANTAYWTIVGLNDIDTNTSIDPVVSGPGAGEVNVLTSISGKLSGLGRLDNNRTYKHSDNMFFKQYDATNSLVHTAETTYKVGGTFAGSNISDAGIAGGALSMATAAGLNDILYLTTGSGSFTDYFYGQYPEMAISFVPVVFTGCSFPVWIYEYCRWIAN